METIVKIFQSGRRLTLRFRSKTPLGVRDWKSAEPEHHTESLFLSQIAVFFASDSSIGKCETAEIPLSMLEVITAEPTPERQYTGHLVREELAKPMGGTLRVGMQSDSYEVSGAERPPPS